MRVPKLIFSHAPLISSCTVFCPTRLKCFVVQKQMTMTMMMTTFSICDDVLIFEEKCIRNERSQKKDS